VEHPAPRPNSPGIVFLASAVGNAFEQYDFLIYGTASALFLNKLFFPAADPAVSILATLSVFAVGYCARPIGGVLFAHLGDTLGRRTALISTFAITGVSTILVGCMPTYNTIGIWAPIGLTFLRLLQGIGIGGEHTGSGLIAVENAPKERRGLYGTWPGLGTYVGLLTSAGAFTVASQISGDQFLAWGWRLPFLISIVLLLVGTVIRLQLAEAPAFRVVHKEQSTVGIPVITVLREYPKTVLTVIACRIGELGWGMLVTIFGASYIVGPLGLSRSVFLNAFEIAAVVGLIMLPLYGMLADYIGRRHMYMLGAILAAVFAYPFFWLLQTRDPTLICLALIIANGVVQALLIGTQSALFCELFDSRVRYTGVALGQQVGAAIGGGIIPILWAALAAEWGGGSPLPVASSMIMLCVIVVLAVFFTPDRRHLDLTASADEWRAAPGSEISGATDAQAT
jgi:MFS transporter, MHS family, shikimate and dehydroshikimate transport protein